MVDLRKELGAIDLSKRFDDLAKFRVPTGIVVIDKIIAGGIPSGKLTEISGGYSAGKSRLGCHILAETLKMGGIAVFADVERSLAEGLAELTGLDEADERFIYLDPDELLTVENVFTALNKFIKLARQEYPDKVLTFVWDSIAAMPIEEDVKRWEKEGKLGVNTGSARRAKAIGDGLKLVLPEVYKSNVCFVCINQVRDRIGIQFGEKTDTPGGKAVKFHASLRLKVNLIGGIKDDKTEERVGSKVQLINIKSKVGVPFGMANFEMMVQEPINKYAGLFDYMLRHSEIEKVGAKKYKFGDQNDDQAWTRNDFVENYESSKATT